MHLQYTQGAHNTPLHAYHIRRNNESVIKCVRECLCAATHLKQILAIPQTAWASHEEEILFPKVLGSGRSTDGREEILSKRHEWQNRCMLNDAVRRYRDSGSCCSICPIFWLIFLCHASAPRHNTSEKDSKGTEGGKRKKSKVKMGTSVEMAKKERGTREILQKKKTGNESDKETENTRDGRNESMQVPLTRAMDRGGTQTTLPSRVYLFPLVACGKCRDHRERETGFLYHLVCMFLWAFDISRKRERGPIKQKKLKTREF